MLIVVLVEIFKKHVTVLEFHRKKRLACAVIQTQQY